MTVRRRELKQARARLGMTQPELGKALNLHRTAIAKYEGGTLPVPKVVALAVAHLLATRKSA